MGTEAETARGARNNLQMDRWASSPEMIISNISGGLGNQMFQYATGRALALKNNTTLKLDISSYMNDKFGRHYSLDIFNIKASLATSQEINKLKPFENIITNKSPRLYKFFSNLSKTYVCDEIIPRNVDQLYLDGYWQNEKYFIDYRIQILKDFELKNNLSQSAIKLLVNIKKSAAVSIHIRRGDYVKRGVDTCSVQYYQRAIDFIIKRINNPIFYIFSEPDGIGWAKSKLKIKNTPVYINGKDYEDLILMSNCKHNIVANSSFSWWGAWLNENPKKIVVAPDPWFTHRKTDNIPHDWFKVPKEA